MARYTSRLFSFTLIITLVFFTIITTAAVIKQPCTTEGHVEFFPDFNKDFLSGVITFSETSSGDRVTVDGIFATDIGVDGIKDDEKPLYTAELYDNKGVLLYDLTDSVFNNAIELVSFDKQYANLQICSPTNSIIGKVVVVKRDGDEIARAEIYSLLDSY
ncbi:hypothetical protein C1645_769079 [Glomus cerebriforme]|uniref:DM13 domain-containing protein n=1 Tax=Glomus cerebriforme TaxID=658196 RepID=A0A397SYP4_9GLOM|nr:hypothetical protein C1645_769079 [Glomus cerebriforme]